MINSMTAFARHVAEGDWGRAIWEIRSVNHRYLDISLRLSDDVRALEPHVRERINQRLSRGKVDCTLRYEPPMNAGGTLAVNDAAAHRLIEAAETISARLPATAAISAFDVLRWPGVLESTAIELDAISEILLTALGVTLDNLVENRAREGEKLREFVTVRIEDAKQHAGRLRELAPTIIEEQQQRLRNRIADLDVTTDPGRLEQELVLLANRLDVSEEFDRLDAHLEEVAHVIEEGGAVGRRLDFLMQELNREANTLGSKSAHIDTTGGVVELKVLIEQMREQIQNIE